MGDSQKTPTAIAAFPASEKSGWTMKSWLAERAALICGAILAVVLLWKFRADTCAAASILTAGAIHYSSMNAGKFPLSNIAGRFMSPTARMSPYRSGTRVSQTTGETVFVFEFKQPVEPAGVSTVNLTQMIQNFIAGLFAKIPGQSATTQADGGAAASSIAVYFVALAKDEALAELQRLPIQQIVAKLPALASLLPASQPGAAAAASKSN